MNRLLALATNLFPVWVLLGGALALHAGGFFPGYLFARLLRFDAINCRTISIEVGMQNSGLGAALAAKHFAAMPLAPLPCAISATFHSVIGSILAGLWRLRPPRKPGETRPA